MNDILIECLRALIVGAAILSMLRSRHSRAVSAVNGSRLLISGFLLIWFGTIIDITDNFQDLNRFVIIGDTEVQSFLEKVVGYLLGFLLVALGIHRWLPKIVEHEALSRRKLEVQAERLAVFRATMLTVHDIVNNFLNSLLLFRLEAEDGKPLPRSSLDMIEDMIHDTSARLSKLGNLETLQEKKMPGGSGIEYEDQHPS